MVNEGNVVCFIYDYPDEVKECFRNYVLEKNPKMESTDPLVDELAQMVLDDVRNTIGARFNKKELSRAINKYCPKSLLESYKVQGG